MYSKLLVGLCLVIIFKLVLMIVSKIEIAIHKYFIRHVTKRET